ncbi:S-layer homology domain-containing protein [Bacillus sp. FJAT-29790]|uniref:S-layer homology domain-containing protein n=1 Tax=Bacillus sp. FJAT-29790 TaxID=1895002 RepID=UPI001C24A816|nr:S-layer homology domain-containing protein [Bacillus sp. FJAT-29790]MBU8880483.1 S-layer homology domain-containing protein [Bacillus sp. FJAT-29790]
MTKKIITLLLAVLFIFINIESAFASQSFKDVDSNFWAYSEIEYLAKRDILNNDSNGRFSTNDKITRIQAAEMIIKARHLQTSNRPAPNFKDVTPDDNGYTIIATIADEGIMNGNQQGEFKPEDKLTRAQMAAILVKAYDLKGTDAYSFRDVGKDHWASSEIKILFANNITTGYSDNTFKPNEHISRAQFAVFLARILNPSFKQTIACYKPDNTKKFVINVAVATLWAEPDKQRTLDKSALSNPVDLAKWTKGMNVNQKAWLVGKLETQALYGQEVVILQSKGNWHQVAVKDQYTPKNKNGYAGWVPKSHITETYPNYETCKIAIIDDQTVTLYNAASTKDKFLDVSFNTRFPVIKEETNWLQIQTPANGVKYIRKQDAMLISNEKSIPKPSQQDIVNTAKKFIGLPYLWAGTSGFGFDCSGFTHAVYKRHGIMIPRDASVQFQQGTVVEKSKMQPGDLMFFAYNNGKGRVHHVSMYIGNGQMIHSPNSSKSIEIISINTQPYKSEFAGTRRFVK